MDRMPKMIYTGMPYCFTKREDVDRCISKINAAGFKAKTEFFKGETKSFWGVTAKEGNA